MDRISVIHFRPFIQLAWQL